MERGMFTGEVENSHLCSEVLLWTCCGTYKNGAKLLSMCCLNVCLVIEFSWMLIQIFKHMFIDCVLMWFGCFSELVIEFN